MGVFGVRSYDGLPVDGGYRHFSERPYGSEDGETVYATGELEETEWTEGTPHVESDPSVERPDVSEQSSFEDWMLSYRV